MAEFITRTELAEKIGITNSGIEKAKAGNTALWKAITAQMDIKTQGPGRREYYRFKNNPKKSLEIIKANSGPLKGPREIYGGKENTITAVKKLLNKSKTSLTANEIIKKFPDTSPATIQTAVDRLKKDPDYKNKIKITTGKEIADQTAKVKALKREPFIKIVRDVFVQDPDATTQDVAEAMVGTKKYNSASLTSKYNYDTAARKNIVKFLEVVGPGSKQKIKGFKDIEPDKLGDILESIESRISDFGFEAGSKREVQLAIADAAKGLPPRTGEEVLKKLRTANKAVDHVIPLASVFKDAPGYTEAGQVIDFNTNKLKGSTLDADFGKTFKKVLKGDFSSVDNYNKKALDFASANNVDTPLIRIGNNLNPKDYVANFDNFSKGAKQNIIDLSKEKGFVIQTKTKTLAMLNEGTNQLINSTEKLTKPEQLKFCKFLSNGGLPGDCKQAIKKDPEKAAKILSEAPVTSAAMNNVKKDSQKLIRLFRGIEPDRPTQLYKATKGMPGMYEESLKGRFFFDNPADARYYAQRQGTTTGKVLSVDVPENMVNIGRKMSERRRGPRLANEVILPKKFVGKEKVNIPQTAFARAQAITEGVTDKLKWDNIVGAFTTKDGDIASQADIKTYAADNPMEVKVGEEPIKTATNKSVLGNVGKALARVGAPLPTALLDSYFIGQQVKEGKGTAEIASNPLNWLGLATMEPLSKVAGIAEGGAFNKVLRLGLNPATIRGITRFAGLPGLAISTALTAYDQYQKYKDGEGFIFNLLNQKGTE